MMQRFYVSWSYRFQGEYRRVGFEYVVHPSRSEDGASYCTALIDASDKNGAWTLVEAAFPGSTRHLVEDSSYSVEQSFAAIKKISGMQVVGKA